jgi:hypothetical protein
VREYLHLSLVHSVVELIVSSNNTVRTGFMNVIIQLVESGIADINKLEELSDSVVNSLGGLKISHLVLWLNE